MKKGSCTTLLFERKLDTCDPKDRAFKFASCKVIATSIAHSLSTVCSYLAKYNYNTYSYTLHNYIVSLAFKAVARNRVA